MSYVKIDPSGCCLRKGYIQVRLNMYLEPTDPNYMEHHVYAVDETSQEFKEGYKGKVDSHGLPIQTDLIAWFDSLPHVWRDNPFNNHFIYMDAGTTDVEIKTMAQEALTEFIEGRKQGKNPIEVWQSKPRPKIVEKVIPINQKSTYDAKLEQITELIL